MHSGAIVFDYQGIAAMSSRAPQGPVRTEAGKQDKYAVLVEFVADIEAPLRSLVGAFNGASVLADIETPLRILVGAFNATSTSLRADAPEVPRPEGQAEMKGEMSLAVTPKVPTAWFVIEAPHPGMMAGVSCLPGVQAMVAEATRVLGFNVEQYCQTADSGSIVRDVKRRLPVSFVASCAALEMMKMLAREGAQHRQHLACGGSGLLVGMHAAGVLDFEDGVNLARILGDTIHRATQKVPQLTVLVDGISRSSVESMCKKAVDSDQDTIKRSKVCDISLSMGPTNFMCGGTRATVELFCESAKRSGARSVVPWSNFAMCTPMMQPIAVEMSAIMQSFLPKMKAPECPMRFYGTDVEIEAGAPPSQIVDLLEINLTKELMVERCCQRSLASGVLRFVEFGPAPNTSILFANESIARRSTSFCV